jgi:anthranilate/para-aminobenzoate synthase component II
MIGLIILRNFINIDGPVVLVDKDDSFIIRLKNEMEQLSKQQCTYMFGDKRG